MPDERRVHRIPIPRLGGLAMFFGIIVPSLAFLDLTRPVRGVLIGAAVATAVGAIDDFRGLAWWEKLGGQVARRLDPVDLRRSGSTTSRSRSSASTTCPAWVGGPLTVIWIVAVMNMVNFLDGLDGLAAGRLRRSPA